MIVASTDPSTDPLVSYVLATYNRPDDLKEAIESILNQTYDPIEVIVVSNSTDDTSTMFEDGGRFDEPTVHYHEFPGRMGVPQARNIGYDLASGDILVTIDDDAVLTSNDATETVVRLFDSNPEIGVLAFQCRDYRTDEVNPHETPDPPRFDMTPTVPYRATNFVGVGNAIRSAVIDRVGDFPEDFVYGFEEMDLSFRVHESGYDILFTPEVAVWHKKSPEARRTDLETQERLVGNRIKLALRNLPMRYVVVSAILWSVYGLLLTRQPSSLLNIYRRLYDERETTLEARHVVSPRTIRRIKSRKTMLFFWWYGPHPGRLFGKDGTPQRVFWETSN